MPEGQVAASYPASGVALQPPQTPRAEVAKNLPTLHIAIPSKAAGSQRAVSYCLPLLVESSRALPGESPVGGACSVSVFSSSTRTPALRPPVRFGSDIPVLSPGAVIVAVSTGQHAGICLGLVDGEQCATTLLRTLLAFAVCSHTVSVIVLVSTGQHAGICPGLVDGERCATTLLRTLLAFAVCSHTV